MIRTLNRFGGLFAGLVIFVLANGLHGILTPLRAEAEHFAPLTIGLIGSAYYAGFVLGCWKIPWLLRRLGHAGSFAALCAAMGVEALIQGAFPLSPVWVLTRFGVGISSAGVYLVIESWLNEKTTNETRGETMSLYTILTFGGTALGQMLMTQAPVTDFTLFGVTAAISLAAGLPMLMMRKASRPSVPGDVRIHWRELFAAAPVGLTGSFVVGVTNSALWSLGPVYATSQGLDASSAALLMSILVITGAASQWPFARLSDFIDRRIVLVSAVMGALLFGQVLINLSLDRTSMMIVFAGFGFFLLPIYAMAASCAYDEASGGNVVEMASAVLLVNGLGSVIGPMIASSMMQHWGPGGLFGSMALVHIAFVLFVVTKIRSRRVA